MTREQAIAICQDFNDSAEDGYVFVLHPTRYEDDFNVALSSRKKIKGHFDVFVTAIHDEVIYGPPDDLEKAIASMKTCHKWRWDLGGQVVKVYNDCPPPGGMSGSPAA